MPIFTYRAVNAVGEGLRGSLQAASQAAALDLIHQRGLIPIEIAVGAFGGRSADMPEQLRRILAGLKTQIHFKARDLSTTTQSLGALLKAGLTIDRALAISASLESRPHIQTFLESLAKAVRSGKTFSDALAESGVELPPYYLSVVHAGEAGGTLPETLTSLAELLGRQLEVRERIKSALVYPALLSGVVLFTLTILVTFVLPRFRALFNESEVSLPLSTRAVLALGDFMASYWWAVAALLCAAAYALRTWAGRAESRRRIDRWMLKARITFGIPAALETARLFRTLSTLLRNGITLSSALRIAKGTLVNVHLRAALEAATERVNAGQDFTAALAASKAFPSQAIQLARVGEETGSLDDMFLQAATLLDRDSQTRIERLLTLLVPVLTIVMGLIVAAIIGSVLVGLLSLNELAF